MFALAFVTLFLTVIWLVLRKDLARCNCRVAGIEEKVNELLKDEVLKWETGKKEGSKFNIFRYVYPCNKFYPHSE